ncbi:hypothetical protein ACJX0J_041451 [Zea mays]
MYTLLEGLANRANISLPDLSESASTCCVLLWRFGVFLIILPQTSIVHHVHYRFFFSGTAASLLYSGTTQMNIAKYEIFMFISTVKCVFFLFVVFVGVIQSILTSGKQLQKLVLEDIGIVSSPHKSVHSPLLRRLINTASSSTILNSAVKLLSCLNKDAADQGDMLNLFIASVDQFPEVAEGHVNVKMAEHKLDLLIQITSSIMYFLNFFVGSGAIELCLCLFVDSQQDETYLCTAGVTMILLSIYDTTMILAVLNRPYFAVGL